MPNVIYKDDEEYPSLLKKIGKDAPKQLYYKVFDSLLQKTKFFKSLSPSQQAEKHVHAYDLKSLSSSQDISALQKESKLLASTCFYQDIFNNCLAVVGSRKLTHYGEQVIEKLVGEVAMAGITIVSGFMYGGDALAHKTAVKVKGRTIAVMPCGIDRISPEDQEDLYNEILENNGMIISEYEGEMAPALWTYPRRNRIVAGLSKAVLVIEAGEKSGSLITANLAKKFKRKIFAVPGPITSSVSRGTNMLIKEGAEMVLEAKDILRWFKQIRYSPQKRAAPDKVEGLSSLDEKQRKRTVSKALGTVLELEKQILVLLEREPLTVDEMSRDLEVLVSELGVKLSMMEMQGLIEMKGDKYYNIK